MASEVNSTAKIAEGLAQQAPLNLQLCYTASEDTFPLPLDIKQRYGPFGFPESATGRPYISSNLVMGLDGRASFRELPGRAGGNLVSRSKEDRWLMDFLRTHHDAQLIGASTLREEPGPDDGLGWDYGIDDEQLLAYVTTRASISRPRYKCFARNTACGHCFVKVGQISTANSSTSNSSMKTFERSLCRS